MATQKIDGKLFELMIGNGLNNIILNEKQVNDMNVFPVPDGDTGTNMRLTLANGIQKAGSASDLSEYISALSSGMLLGARGNSGVILSQIFKGICSELVGLSEMNTSDFLRALICGYKTAYAAVVNPVEGTVLTVAREGTEYAASLFEPETSFETILEYYIQGMKRSLKNTPKLLPVLMQAGVEDSGAMGFIVIVEGMYRYLCGEDISVSSSFEVESSETVNIDAFTSDSRFDFGYCMEFLLRLMSAKTDVGHFDLSSFTENLKTMGESVVSVQDGSVVKVHIHVFKPAEVISYAQQFGEFLTFKLENMCLQHNEKIQVPSKKKAHIPLAVIAVGNGYGIKNTLTGFDFVTYLDGGSTMNTSTQEFIDAINGIEADRIVIMPNNKNVVKAARQAVELLHNDCVEVIESCDVVQCFYALSMDMPDDSVDNRIASIKQSCNELVAMRLFKAVRECNIDNVQCKEGDFVCSVGSSLVSAGSDFTEVLKLGIKSVEAYSDKEMCFAFTGKNFDKQSEVESLFKEEFSDIGLQLIPGGQEHIDLILGLA